MSGCAGPSVLEGGPSDGFLGGFSGVSGEYFVAAELSRVGYIASITLRKTRGRRHLGLQR